MPGSLYGSHASPWRHCSATTVRSNLRCHSRVWKDWRQDTELPYPAMPAPGERRPHSIAELRYGAIHGQFCQTRPVETIRPLPSSGARGVTPLTSEYKHQVPARAALAICSALTPKKSRKAARVSLRPKSSVPRVTKRRCPGICWRIDSGNVRT